MDKIVEHLQTVESVSKRLEALASVRGCPSNVAERLMAESKTLRWAFKELKAQHFTDVMCLVGTNDYISTIPGLEVQPSEASIEATKLAVFLEFHPDPLRSEQIKEYLIGDSAWPGDRLPPEKIPEFLFCERYIACGQSDDPTKRAVLLNCIVKKEYLAEKGLGVARSELGNWLQNLFIKMKWSDAKSV